MPRSGSTTLALPPFTGATRRIIAINLVVFFVLAILGLVLPTGWYSLLNEHLILTPAFLAHGEIWQLLTYVFLPLGLLGTFLANLTIWFIAPMLEDSFGARWLYQLYFVSAAGAALVASLLSFTHVVGLTPLSFGIGPESAIFGMLIVIGIRFGDLEFLLLFIVRIRARYLVAIYILIDLALVLKSANPFQAVLELSGALAGYLYLRYAPRRGFAVASVSERMYALRNEYYRAKRRRAAKKFEVYMRGQNRDVHFDKDGRYVEPNETRDPNDRRWMN